MNTMPTRVWAILLIALVSIAALLAGCGSPSSDPMLIYIPFIEEIDVPQRITAGEEFALNIQISTDSRPDLLTGDKVLLSGLSQTTAFDSGVIQGKYENGKFLPIALELVESIVPQQLSVAGGEIQLNLLFSDAGSTYIYLPSTRAAASGGAAVSVDSTLGEYQYPPESDLIEYREIVIEVLPAE